MSARRSTNGFTIVELLIVVVIIAILAVITVVAFNGLQNRARASQASAALSQAKNKLEIYKVENSAYPATGNLASAGVADGPTTYQYTSDSTSYCLTATVANVSYYLNSTTVANPTQGGCAGHGQGGVAAVTNLVTNPSLETNTTGWGNYNAGGVITSSRPLSGGAQGVAHYRITWTGVATGKGGGCYIANMGSGQLIGSTPYTLSIWVRSNVSQTVNMQLEWKNSSLALIGPITYGPAVTLTPNTWTRVVATATAPATAYAITFPVYGSGSGTIWQVGEYLDCDAAMLTAGSTPYVYADGSSNNWVWNGTPNASTSTGPAP